MYCIKCGKYINQYKLCCDECDPANEIQNRAKKKEEREKKTSYVLITIWGLFAVVMLTSIISNKLFNYVYSKTKMSTIQGCLEFFCEQQSEKVIYPGNKDEYEIMEICQKWTTDMKLENGESIEYIEIENQESIENPDSKIKNAISSSGKMWSRHYCKDFKAKMVQIDNVWYIYDLNTKENQ